jgi:Flp pilus assembly pilin Flp
MLTITKLNTSRILKDRIQGVIAKGSAFVKDDAGQDFMEYALILGAVAVVALAVLGPFKNELRAAFQSGIDALRAARGG